MSKLLAGAPAAAHNVVVFGGLRMWAERGLIHIEDANDNSYKAVSVRTILHRMRGIQQMISNSTGQKAKANRENSALAELSIEHHQGMLEAMCEVVAKAQAQGMPSDASARRDLVRRRPKTVVVPGYGGGM